jgi:DNA-binding beta-propeller fold protein YncE
MNVRKCWVAIATLVAPALVMAATIQGPQLGFVFDTANKEVRPILGIPGAAVLGGPLKVSVELRSVAISPLENYVLAVVGEHNQVVVLAVGSTPVTSVAVHGADLGPDEMVLSPSGQAAALYYKNRDCIEVVGGLPAAAKVSSELYLSAGQSPSAIAVSDDGRTVLAAVGGTVFHLTGGSEVPVLTELGNVSAMTIPATGTAFVADSGRNQIHRIRGIGGAIETDVIAGPHDGINGPVAVAISRDNSRAFVANGKAKTLATVELTAQPTVIEVACGFTPTGLTRLAGNDVFRLTEMSNLPMWVMEANGGEPRFLFVPAELARSNGK